ncbi:hypothetical protein Ahy_B05g075667 isoform B [Arachis hypogaea]|uniref:Uncharacterized protein n=1 Tax=Arachis hypogaea TaxID=3818 RepID=A0A444Z1Q2_ARAHY|nr:hypothetical protein Ahy_B05g075667 isoform B [Arachis hypogaea]
MQRAKNLVVHRFDGRNETSNQWNNNTDAVACLNPPSQDSFVYGIYQNVEPLVTETNVINKYIYSLFWRFQEARNANSVAVTWSNG